MCTWYASNTCGLHADSQRKPRMHLGYIARTSQGAMRRPCDHVEHARYTWDPLVYMGCQVYMAYMRAHRDYMSGIHVVFHGIHEPRKCRDT